jgi:hypothetical protein
MSPWGAEKNPATETAGIAVVFLEQKDCGHGPISFGDDPDFGFVVELRGFGTLV